MTALDKQGILTIWLKATSGIEWSKVVGAKPTRNGGTRYATADLECFGLSIDATAWQNADESIGVTVGPSRKYGFRMDDELRQSLSNALVDSLAESIRSGDLDKHQTSASGMPTGPRLVLAGGEVKRV